MNNDTNENLEVMEPSAIMAMEMAQIDQQIATAHRYPRSMELFRKRALSMACLDADTADSCIYVRPVGKEKDEKGRWVQKFAEGPSIRMAEIVAVSYGNIRAAVKVVEQTERYVKCVGMAHDLESNAAMQADVIETTVTKEGEPYSERQRALIAKVCAAKAIRDAIFRVVPRALCKPILEAAKKVASGADKPLDERRKKAQAWVATLKIDEARVLAALGVAGWADVTAEHLVTLTGVKTSMADGDTRIDEAFPPLEKEPGKDPHKPETTKHEQATASKTVPKQDKKEPEPSKMPQDASGGIKAPPAASKPAPAPAPLEDTPTAETTRETTTPETQAEEQAEAEAGLAPVAEQGMTGETDPALADKPTDSDAQKSIKLLGRQANVTSAQITAFCREKKLCKEGQSWGDMATGKLVNLAKVFHEKLAEIKKL